MRLGPCFFFFIFFFNDTATTEIYTLSLHDALPICLRLLTIHRPDRENYDEAVARIDEMERRLASDAAPASVTGPDGGRWEPNMTPGQFHAMVDAAREHIHSGDAFQ